MHKTHRSILSLSAIALPLALAGAAAAGQDPARPNILWIVVEDMSCHFGHQGEGSVETPHVDRLAREGIVFTEAYGTAPVCSASRSAMITGLYQTSIGAHHHRSSRGVEKIQLPAGIRTLPEIFREAGYYCANLAFEAGQPENFGRRGKEDYNFEYQGAGLYDGADWSGRAEGQPFFAQVQLRGGKLRDVARWLEEMEAGLDRPVLPEQVSLPPYYPDDPSFRDDWAAYLNSVQYTDLEVGLILGRLEREQLVDNTIVFFVTDHGISQARGKQFLYDEGSKVPFIVWAPGRIGGGTVRPEPIVHIDMAASSLAWAGIELPAQLQGQDLFAQDYEARDFIVMARDRCDETEDRIRAIRRGEFKYIRNYHPLRPYLQPCAYKDDKPWMKILRTLHGAGQLDATQQLQLADTRPEEELYDLGSDPFETRNLAGDPEQRERLAHFRTLLASWEEESGDRGRQPESEAQYDGEMAVYLDQIGRNNPGQAAIIKGNIRLMKEWRSAGK